MSSEVSESDPSHFSYEVLGAPIWDPIDDNIDVVITLSGGDRYKATFFTIANIGTLFAQNKRTGECAKGLYLWASDMLLVETLDDETLRIAIDDLIKSGELEAACSLLDDEEPNS